MPTDGRYIRYSATSSHNGMTLESTERVRKNHVMPKDASRSSGYPDFFLAAKCLRTATGKGAVSARRDRITGVSNRVWATGMS